ncbi:MAG: AgmX/PglI C-terminal domain-containing protein [Minicystis sp.]
MTTQKPFSFSNNSNPFMLAFAPKNPFLPQSDEVAADAPEGSYTYKLVQNGPEVPAEECEVAVAAVEIMIRWGTTVLHVAELTPPRSFYVGEDLGKGQPKADFFLPEEKLGTRRMPVVLADNGAVKLVIPAGATGTVTLPGAAAKSVRDLVATAEPCAELPGAHLVALPTGARAAIDVAGISFEVAAENAGKKASRVALKGEALPYTGLSFLIHAGLLAATALFMPTMAMADEDRISEDQKYMLMQALSAEAMKEPEQKDEKTVDNNTPTNGGDSGQASKGESGKAGDVNSHATNRRFSVEGKSEDRFLSKSEAVQQARDFGMIGILQSLEGSVNVPTSPWGKEIAMGGDDANNKGNIFGQTIGDAAGSGGLGLTGIGESGGGLGEGIGVGRVGTIGHDFTGGSGHSTGRLNGGHKTKSPSMVHVGVASVSGRLPPEVIQRVVRQNFGRFKACYENGLRNNPSLSGRVAVRFVIGRDGDVSNVANGGSDLPDSGVVSCVTRAFYGLSFPHPENGIVTVTYPIVFSPAN